MTETILQFGTGRFLRAFADGFVDEAIQAKTYQGKIAMIASTPSGRAQLFNQQQGRYTLWTRGYGSDGLINTLHTVEAVSRVLSASSQWTDIVDLARSPHLEAVISNTTEIGLSLVDHDLHSSPQSYPGRLCALLHARGESFQYALSKGLVILPCELIDQNGDLLRNLVVEQANRWNLGEKFLDWLQHSTVFCNTLVDRIVPGLPDQQELESAYETLGYCDELLTVCEPYRLWAIQANDDLRERLGFFKHQDGIVLTPDVEPYRIRKIRLLNGGHTLSVPVALFAGCQTVLDAMKHPTVSQYIESLLRTEIGPILPVDPDTIPPYIDEVLQRWRNPYIHHRLIDITLQSTTKLRYRVVPTVLDYYHRYPAGSPPQRIAVGIAAWLLFMRGDSQSDGIIYTTCHDSSLPIHDDHAEQFLHWWPKKEHLISGFVHEVMSSQDLWGISLDDFPGFTDAVYTRLNQILNHGIQHVLSGTLEPS